MDGLLLKVDEKRRKVAHQRQTEYSASSTKLGASLSQSQRQSSSKKKERLANELFLSSLGDQELVQPLISESKNKKGKKQTL